MSACGAAGGSGAAIAFTYDSTGNMTGDGSRTFAYNHSGNLLRGTKGTTTVDYRYGPGDTRYLRKEGSGSNDHGDAAGFIRLNALRLRTLAQRDRRNP